MADPPGDAVGQQVGKTAVNGRVRLAKDERQLRRIDERHPTERVEHLSFGDGHMSRLAVRRCGAQPGDVSVRY